MTALAHLPARRQPEASGPLLRAVEHTAPAPVALAPAARAAAVSRRRRLGFLASGLLFSAVLGGNVAVYASITQGQFELEHLKNSTSEREAAYQQLRLQVAEAEAPQRVVERARRLGMIEPARITYLTPTSKTSSTEPASSGTASAPPPEAAQSWGRVKPHLDGRR